MISMQHQRRRPGGWTTGTATIQWDVLLGKILVLIVLLSSLEGVSSSNGSRQNTLVNTRSSVCRALKKPAFFLKNQQPSSSTSSTTTASTTTTTTAAATTVSASAAAAPWQSEAFLSNKDYWENKRRYRESPPTVFAPGGRLHPVERVMEALSSTDDPTSNLVIAIQCQDGIVVVTNVNHPPNSLLMFMKSSSSWSSSSSSSSSSVQNSSKDPANTTTENTNTNTTTDTTTKEEKTQHQSLSLWLDSPAAAKNNGDNDGDVGDDKVSELSASSSRPPQPPPWSYPSSSIVRIPFLENDNIFAITAGDAVHSQVLRHRIRQMAESIYRSNDDGMSSSSRAQQQQQQRQRKCPSVAILARRLGDNLQKPTQSMDGLMLVSCALLFGVNEGIWQIDPTGQFWLCQVAVVGHGADKARSFILQKLTAAATATKEEEKEDGLEKDSSDTAAAAAAAAATAVAAANEVATFAQLHSFLNKLSLHDATKLAGECLQHVMSDSHKGTAVTASDGGSSTANESDCIGPPSPRSDPPFIAFSIRNSDGVKQEEKLNWYYSC